MRKIVTIQFFNTWTSILNYLDDVDKEYKKFNIKYSTDIFFNEPLNSYKVKITV